MCAWWEKGPHTKVGYILCATFVLKEQGGAIKKRVVIFLDIQLNWWGCHSSVEKRTKEKLRIVLESNLNKKGNNIIPHELLPDRDAIPQGSQIYGRINRYMFNEISSPFSGSCATY